jgi:hypothetical protein
MKIEFANNIIKRWSRVRFRSADGGESNSARGFFRWPGCCFDWLLRLLVREFCPMLSNFVNLSGIVLPSLAGSCQEHASQYS